MPTGDHQREYRRLENLHGVSCRNQESLSLSGTVILDESDLAFWVRGGKR